jgi:hypothetical protein
MKMKKYVHFLLIFLLTFLLAACGGTQSDSVADQAQTAVDQIVDSLDEEAVTDEAEEDYETYEEDEESLSEDVDESLPEEGEESLLAEDGTYTSKEDVALYIYQYGHLPDNFITKKEAEKLGWSGGSLEPYAPGKCIGGSRFGNYEGLLPEKDGRIYTECDIDTLGASKRGAKRIVYSNDGLIYYTGDHYETFELLYGEED